MAIDGFFFTISSSLWSGGKLHHRTPIATEVGNIDYAARRRIAILGSLIKGLQDLWSRLDDEIAFDRASSIWQKIISS